MHSGSVSRKMRRKSISLEDLGSIVKQMINGAIDDTEQMAKLHRAIYEELYFEKMTEFEGDNLEKNSSTASSQKTFKAESIKHITESGEPGEYPKEDSRTICIKEKTVNETHSDPEDDRDIEKIDNETITKIIRPKENNRAIQKHRAKIQRKLSLDEHTNRNEQAFDVWKREKTRSMRRMLKEERRTRREELEARQAEIEKKRESHEAYLRLKKLQKAQLKLEEIQRQAIEEAYLRMHEQKSERTVANEEAFKAWKQQKDNQSRQGYCQPRRQRMQKKRANYCNDTEFDTWLDQLDSVLHQKYLRERRYLVRSFYCQPAYYGTAALSMQ